jgi:hypothetical protein
MGAILRRPASALALALSLAWVGASVYEIAIKQTGDFFPARGAFIIAYTTIQTAAIGVIAFLGLAVLVERVWPGLVRPR